MSKTGMIDSENCCQAEARSDSPNAPEGRLQPAAFFIVLLTALITYGIHTERPDPQAHDELFYLTGALAVNETGDWLIPTYRGEPRLKKPPLQYWLVAMSYRLFGVGVMQGRLPSVLAATASVGLVYWIGLMLFRSHRAGLYSACTLMSSDLFMRRAHSADTDMVLAFIILLAFCGFATAFGRSNVWGAPLAWVAMAFAVLQKGPIGLLLPLISIVVWRIWTRGESQLDWRKIFSPMGIIFFLVIALPWPILALNRLGVSSFANPVEEEIGYHLSFSVFRALSYCGNYLAASVWAIFPLSLLLVVLASKCGRMPGAKLLWTWCAVLVLLFSFVVFKRRARYLIPAVPALAVLCGCALAFAEEWFASNSRPWRWIRWGTQAWFAGALLASVPLLIAAKTVIQIPAAVVMASLLAAFAFCMLLILPQLARKATLSTWVVTATVGIAVVHTLYGKSFDATMPEQPTHALARHHLRNVDPGEIVVAGLDDDELSWAWVGAGFSFGPGASFTRKETIREPRWLLTTREAVDAMSPEHRALYTDVEQARSCSERPPLINLLMLFDDFKSEWQRDERHFILLRRQ